MSVVAETEESTSTSGKEICQDFRRTRIFPLAGHADADHVQHDGDAD